MLLTKHPLGNNIQEMNKMATLRGLLSSQEKSWMKDELLEGIFLSKMKLESSVVRDIFIYKQQSPICNVNVLEFLVSLSMV